MCCLQTERYALVAPLPMYTVLPSWSPPAGVLKLHTQGKVMRTQHQLPSALDTDQRGYCVSAPHVPAWM